MIEPVLLVLLYTLDLAAWYFGFTLYLALLFPYYLFLLKRSTWLVLSAAFVVGALLEMLHGLIPGSLLLGLGLALFVLKTLENYVAWRSIFVRIVAFLFFLSTALTGRLLLSLVAYRSFVIPSPTAWLFTGFIGVALLLAEELFDRVNLFAGKPL